jgi:hypothetical protein
MKSNDKIISEHLPVSIPIFSNVPEYDDKPIFICDCELRKLILRIVKTILKISLKAKSINENEYNHIIKFLDAYVYNVQNDLDKFKERNGWNAKGEPCSKNPSHLYDDN